MFDNFFQKYITAKNVIFFIISVLFIILIFKNFDIALVFFSSFVIACSLNPFVDKIVSKKINRNTASLIVLSGMVLLFLLFFVPTVFLAASEISSFTVHFPQYVDELDDFVNELPFIEKLGFSGVNMDAIASALSASSENILKSIVNIGTNISSAVLYLIISIMVTFYFMADKESIRKTYLAMFPSEMRKNADNIMNIISQKIGGYIVALVVTMASVGIVMIIGLMLLGVQYSLLLGLITAVFDIIPVIGPAIALVICIVTTYQDGPTAVFAVIAVFTIAQLVENNFVRPYIFGKLLNLHPLIIYLFLFLAAKYLGFLGVIFAPAIAATFCVLIEELYMKKLG